MNISEIEKLTGISKQAIRFYEKEGLIFPKRNEGNQYREYDEKDIKDLKLIYILRKTGFSLSEIKRVMNKEVTLSDAVKARRKEILEERREQDELLNFCDDLKMQSLEWIDLDQYIEKIQSEEKKGSNVFQVIEEYKQVYQGEKKKEFFFYPDNIIESPNDFVEALLKYAKEEKADIIITKESMYPEFVLNGVEYSALRRHGRFGSVVYCEMKYPELAEPENVTGVKKKVMQSIAKVIPGLVIILLICLVIFGELIRTEYAWLTFGIMITYAAAYIWWALKK